MFEIDNAKFGAFLSQLRKEKGFTQKELAQKLFISDKAVSKWERGLSMPDISLLAPLAGLLGVTITELLSGQYIAEPEQLNKEEVEKLVSGTVRLSEEEEKQRRQSRVRRGFAYFTCAAIAVLECVFLYTAGYSILELRDNLLLVEFLCFLFGGWLCLFVKETLPAYYDENRISFYSDGVFRMNVAGIHFNNSNWPHILHVGRTWTLAVSVLYPAAYFAVSRCFPEAWNSGKLFFIMTAVLGLFIPIIVVGKRYE